MNSKLIKELKNVYNVKPSNYVFINKYKQNDMSTLEFIFLQSKYLHSFFFVRCVLFSLVLIFVSLFSSSKDGLMLTSALIPFVVLVMIYELDSSRIFKMEEVESSTKFSLKMIIFSRLFIVGIISLICLIVLTLLTFKIKKISILEIINSFFLPYFLTVYSCLTILRRNREHGIKISFVLSTVVSMLIILLRISSQLSLIFFKTNIGLIVLLLLIVLSLIESKKLVCNYKEAIWS